MKREAIVLILFCVGACITSTIYHKHEAAALWIIAAILAEIAAKIKG